MFSTVSSYEDYTPIRIDIDWLDGHKAHVKLGNCILIMSKQEISDFADKLNQAYFEMSNCLN